MKTSKNIVKQFLTILLLYMNYLKNNSFQIISFLHYFITYTNKPMLLKTRQALIDCTYRTFFI